MALKQTYNSRSKKWVLYDDSVKSGIKHMQAQKYDGVPVKGGENEEQPEISEIENESISEPGPDTQEPIQEPENMDSKKSSWFDIFSG